MVTTSPDNVWTPDHGDKFALTTDLATTAQSVQSALIRRTWTYTGTDAQRLALAAPELRDGITWEEPSTGRQWTRRGGAWVEKDLVRNLGRITPVTTGNQGGITTTRTKASGSTLNVTLASPTWLRFYGNLTTYSTNIADVALISITDGDVANTIYEMTTPPNSSSTISATGRAQTVITEALITAGAHSFALAVQRVAGAGTITISPGAKSPTTFSIDRIG